jgi:RimJ/RimL family protein N-acetyltransferase
VARRENLASRRVLERLGLRYQGLRFHYGLNLVFCGLSRSDYLAGANGDAAVRPRADA